MLAVLAVAASLLACAAATAAPVDVSLRIEGRSSTLYEGPLTVSSHPVDGGDGSGAHGCGGGAPSAITALDAAAARGGFAWRATWNPDFQDFFVDRIGADGSNPATASYWAMLANWRYTGGACATALAPGAELLWAYDIATRPLVLRLTGPTRAAVGQQVTVAVRDGWVRADSGHDGGPVAGALVGGTTTDSTGRARLAFTTPGLKRLKAERGDAIRSNVLDICVGNARCEGALPAPGDAQDGARPDRAGPGARTARAALLGATRYLLRAQRPGGGFGPTPGARPSALFTGWAAIGLGSSGRSGEHERPPTARRRDPESAAVQAGVSDLSLLERRRVALARAGRVLRSPSMRPRSLADIERGAIALARIGGAADRRRARLLRAALIRRQRRDGSFGGDVNATAYAIVALRSGGGSHHAVVRRARAWLLGPHGAFGGRGHPGRAGADTIGAALWALRRSGGRHATAAAVELLRARQNRDGGFGMSAGDASNSQSTALAVLGLASAGRDPRRVRNGDASPVDFLRACARRDGAIAYRRDDSRTPVWSTAQALAALGAL